jgi:hypothetical protein
VHLRVHLIITRDKNVLIRSYVAFPLQPFEWQMHTSESLVKG